MFSMVHNLGSSGRLLTMVPRFLSAHAIKNNDITKIPLSEFLPNDIRPLTVNSFIEDRQTKITTLSNGLKVTSQDTFGAQCAIGVIVNAGPRYEVDRISGLSHFLEKLGFHSSEAFEDRNQVQAVLEECNAIFDCQISRDFIIYAVSGFNTRMDRLVHALSETVLRARLTEEEVEMAERSIRFELESMLRNPPIEPTLNELIHQVAYRGTNTIGLPRYCPKENLGQIRREHLVNFMATYYRPERMIVAGVGVDHDEFVKSVEQSFMPFELAIANDPAAKHVPEPDQSVAQFTGGYLKVDRDLTLYHAPMPEFAHVSIGLESVSALSDDFVTASLLQSLLGGGGSFSSGGPGKGMYTRLYVNVLNEYHWVNSAQAENFSYADSGLFALHGSAQPHHLDQLVYTLASELRHTMATPISDTELMRAKAQLKSMLLMNLETRAASFEDIARQVLTFGFRRQPEYWVDKIDKVSADQLQSLVKSMMTNSPLAVVGYGRVDQLPNIEEIREVLLRPTTSGGGFGPRFSNMFKRFV